MPQINSSDVTNNLRSKTIYDDYIRRQQIAKSGNNVLGATQLNNSEHHIILEASNKSKESKESKLTPPIPPKAPSNLKASIFDQLIILSWTPTTSIIYYTVFCSSIEGEFSILVPSNVTSQTVNPLRNGIPYTFTVMATNSVGSSSKSESITAIASRPPSPPTNITKLENYKEVTLAWDAPMDNGGSAIVSYNIYYYITASGESTAITYPVSGPTTITNLTNNVNYTFYVKTVNAAGLLSIASDSISATPLGLPGKPTIVSTVRGNAQVTIEWKDSNNGGSEITSYTITPSPLTISPVQVYSSPFTVTGLINGQPYTFTIVATNVKGDSIASDPSSIATPATLPEPPTDVAANGIIGTTLGPYGAVVRVSWTPAVNNGSPINMYRVKINDGNPIQISGTPPASTIDLTGLVYGTQYTFSVCAINGIGPSEYVVSNTTIPYTIPDPPTDFSGVRIGNQTLISWTPAFNGGDRITGYTLTNTTTNTVYELDSVTLSYNVTDLTEGNSYTFTIATKNRAGASSAPLPSIIV